MDMRNGQPHWDDTREGVFVAMARSIYMWTCKWTWMKKENSTKSLIREFHIRWEQVLGLTLTKFVMALVFGAFRNYHFPM